MIWSTLLLAFRALRRNSLRSALTMLGIVIGVAAVIAIVTLGSGASQRGVGRRLESRRPAAVRESGHEPRRAAARRHGAPVHDARCRGDPARRLGPSRPSRDREHSCHAVYGNNHWPVNVTGITKDYFAVRNATLARGAEFNEGQYQGGAARVHHRQDGARAAVRLVGSGRHVDSDRHRDVPHRRRARIEGPIGLRFRTRTT